MPPKRTSSSDRKSQKEVPTKPNQVSNESLNSSQRILLLNNNVDQASSSAAISSSTLNLLDDANFTGKVPMRTIKEEEDLEAMDQ